MVRGPYTPREKINEILSWCLEKVNSVPYRPTLRWIFYRASQQFGLPKKDYHKFMTWTIDARKGFKGGWTPETLADDTRQIHALQLHDAPKDWYESFLDAQCNLDPWFKQPRVVMICFEAHAMLGQFRSYAPPYVPLVPFGGEATIDLKSKISTVIRNFDEKYSIPITVLYYGDYDPKGLTIPDNAFKDVREWSGIDFEVIRLGLSLKQTQEWGIPDNPERPGQYQWEALDDDRAQALIKAAYSYLNCDELRKNIEAEKVAQELFREHLRDFISDTEEETT